MLLCLDFGNTRLKYATFKDENLHSSGIVPEMDWNCFLSIPDFGIVSKVIICASIEVPTSIVSALSSRFTYLHVAADHTSLLFSKYDESTLGEDRLVMAEAGIKLFAGSAYLTISLGTCIAYNLVNAKKEFVGGIISPGLLLRAQSMHNFTYHLPLVKPTNKFSEWGTDTRSNLTAGIMTGVLHEITGHIAEAKKKHTDLKVILTGGDAIYYKDKFDVEPDLMWIGLLEIAKNQITS